VAGYGCRDVVLIQPKKRPKVKTDRRDANLLSELLCINWDRIAAGQPIRGVRRVVVPSKIHAENQRITMIRQQVGRQRTRTINQIRHILRRHNLQWQLLTKTFPTVRAMAWLRVVKLPTWDREEMDYHLEEFKRLTVARCIDLEPWGVVSGPQTKRSVRPTCRSVDAHRVDGTHEGMSGV
jgi:transposase